MDTNLVMTCMFLPASCLGQGMLNQLGKQPMPGKKALIVISNGKSTRANGYLARTEEQLKKAVSNRKFLMGFHPTLQLPM